VQAAVHSRAVVDVVSHVVEVFKDNNRALELRDPFDYTPRHFVQSVVNIVTFLGLDGCLERSLVGRLHPFPLREELVALSLHICIVEDDRIAEFTVTSHRGEGDTVLVHVYADNRVCIVLVSDFGVFVSHGNVQSPLTMVVDDFSSADPPRIVFKCSLNTVKMVCTSLKLAFDVCTACCCDSESDVVTVVVGEQAVAFAVVHNERVCSVDVRVWTAPVVVFVVVVGFEFSEGFVHEKLAGVFDVVGVVYDY